MIFVFGSNLAGRHGAGSARHANRCYGARYGISKGPTGNAYAIPTKDEHLRTLPLDIINGHVNDFLAYARLNLDKNFRVVAIGCGLAGYNARQIAPMFTGRSPNVQLPDEFMHVLTTKE